MGPESRDFWSESRDLLFSGSQGPGSYRVVCLGITGLYAWEFPGNAGLEILDAAAAWELPGMNHIFPGVTWPRIIGSCAR